MLGDTLHWPSKGERWFALGDPSTGNPSEMDPWGLSSWKSWVSYQEKSPVQGWGQKTKESERVSTEGWLRSLLTKEKAGWRGGGRSKYMSLWLKEMTEGRSPQWGPREGGWERILRQDEDGDLGQKDSEIRVLPPPK